ncbi:hypothetical protein ACFL50_01160 [Candidatus Latescibacterota bacterium]
MGNWFIGFCVGMIIGLSLGMYITGIKNQKQWHELSKTDKVRSYFVMGFIFIYACTILVYFALH